MKTEKQKNINLEIENDDILFLKCDDVSYLKYNIFVVHNNEINLYGFIGIENNKIKFIVSSENKMTLFLEDLEKIYFFMEKLNMEKPQDEI